MRPAGRCQPGMETGPLTNCTGCVLMPALIVRWDHQGDGPAKSREYPIDTMLRIAGSNYGYSTLERNDRGQWVQELTTPGKIFIQGRAY